MKNLVNRVEEIEIELEKREVKRQKVNENKIKNLKAINEASQIKIEKLPYSYDSLKSFIDPETMDVHYNKHYKGYVDKLNLALKSRKTDDSLEKIVKNIQQFNKNIRNNAGGAFTNIAVKPPRIMIQSISCSAANVVTASTTNIDHNSLSLPMLFFVSR